MHCKVIKVFFLANLCNILEVVESLKVPFSASDFSAFVVVYYRKLVTFWKRHVYKKGIEDGEERKIYTRWENDYNLLNVDRLDLLDEYLEMVIQYGFVTLFVAAFPLAPFFAWLNNVIEIRVDSNKYLTTLRRPLAQRAQDIGAWVNILQIITYISVLSNVRPNTFGTFYPIKHATFALKWL